MLSPVPTLDEVATDPGKVRGLPYRTLADLCLKAQSAVNACWAELLATKPESGLPVPARDTWLTAREVAAYLGRSVKWVYENTKRLPFSVVEPGRRPRYSRVGLERYMRERQQGA
jgi:hypothetical protein